MVCTVGAHQPTIQHPEKRFDFVSSVPISFIAASTKVSNSPSEIFFAYFYPAILSSGLTGATFWALSSSCPDNSKCFVYSPAGNVPFSNA